MKLGDERTSKASACPGSWELSADLHKERRCSEAPSGVGGGVGPEQTHKQEGDGEAGEGGVEGESGRDEERANV